MRVLDLFSGIGGFSLGLERAGFETVAFCEIEPFCQQVLKKHWPDVPIYSDITKLTKEVLDHDGIGTIDVICGGYPCQPFSVAGKQKGAKDERHLWPEMFRIIRATKPRWVIAENVSGHIKLGADEVISQMEAEGFTVWPFIIPACAVDALHRRDRLWIVAHSDSSNAGRVTREFSSQKEQEGLQEWDEDRKSGQSGEIPTSFPYANGQRRCGRQCEWQNAENAWELSTSEKFRQWDIEPSVGRVANGIPNRVDRLKALGNAVVPQIPELIGYAIQQYQRGRHDLPL